jgi:hypothetical protein
MNSPNHSDAVTTFIVEVDAPGREAASRAARALAVRARHPVPALDPSAA